MPSIVVRRTRPRLCSQDPNPQWGQPHTGRQLAEVALTAGQGAAHSSSRSSGQVFTIRSGSIPSSSARSQP